MHCIPKAFAALLMERKYLRKESRRYLSRRAGARLSTTTECGLGEILHLCMESNTVCGEIQDSLDRADPGRMLRPNRKVVHSLVP
jgi:hypothetical protein